MRQLKIAKSITVRDSSSLERYLKDISPIALISAKEEIELARKIKNGDQNARDMLTKANLRFVVSVAKQYENQGLKLPDLINEGNLGLIKAAERFDETRGFKFISYAVWWIRQSILQALAEHSRIVRLPINKIAQLKKINKLRVDLEQIYERDPTTLEIATNLEIDEIDVIESLASGIKASSLDEEFDSDFESGLLDFIPNLNSPQADKDLCDESLKGEIDKILEEFSEVEVEIINLCYYQSDNHTRHEIMKKFGIKSVHNFNAIRNNALRKLKRESVKKILRKYL